MVGRLLLIIVAFVLFGCQREVPTAVPPATASGTPREEASLTPYGLAQAMDIPVYPGAEAPDGRSRAPFEDSHGGTRYELVLTTSDPLEKVVGFYRDKLKLDVMTTAGTAQAIGKTPRGNDLILSISREGATTAIHAKAIAYGKVKDGKSAKP